MTSILIIEDDHDTRVSLREFFESENFEVLSAANGKSAIQLLKGFTPSIILLDLMMPLVSGWELLDLMGQDAKLARVPVIIISARRAEPHPRAQAFLRKPLSLESLRPIAERFSQSL